MEMVKMTNKEIIENGVGLMELQEAEKKYFEKTGKKLLQGKIKLIYAISRNLDTFQEALKHYNNVLDGIVEEYRDRTKEAKLIDKERKTAEKEGRMPNNLDIVMKTGKTKEEYLRKVKELQDIEVEVYICKINCELLEGLELDSYELRKMNFMIEE